MKYELPTASPSSVGIPCAAIDRFLARLRDRRLPMHSVLMLRRGKLIFETYWKPFDADRKHRLYSASKSFVSAAIGILIGEGKLTLEDPVTKFFPDKIPENLHPYTAAATIRDLLMMATPHRYQGTTYGPGDPDWADTFFSTPPTHLPGKIFSYDTTATVMLSIIIRRVSGQELTDYLRDRLFVPAGMSPDIDCIETPCGHDWGGSGVLATPRDLARFALCCMNSGRINGLQLIPEDYIRAATSRQIDTTLTAVDAEHSFGYGYQFWMTRHHGFACRGMGAQLAVCLPEQDFILVTTGDTQAVSGAQEIIYESLWKEIYPYLEGSEPAEEEAPGAGDELRSAWSGLEIPVAAGACASPTAQRVSGVTYVFRQPNEPSLRWMRLTFDGDEGLLEYENASGPQRLRFGLGHQVYGQLSQTEYFGHRIGTPKGSGYACAASAGWVMPGQLHIVCYAVDDYLGTLIVDLAFEDDCVTYYGHNNAEWFFDGFWGFAGGERAG